MPLSAQEKLDRKLRLEEKKEARRLAKEKEKASKANAAKASTTSNNQVDASKCCIFNVANDTLNHVLWFLPARDIGALTLSCRHFSELLVEARVSFLMSRLHRPKERIAGTVGCVDMCSSQNEAR
jgi:hypothetical protein